MELVLPHFGKFVDNLEQDPFLVTFKCFQVKVFPVIVLLEVVLHLEFCYLSDPVVVHCFCFVLLDACDLICVLV